MIDLVFIIISILLVVVFLWDYIMTTHELPESISATVYEMPKGGEWLWSVWLVGVSACLFVPLVESCGWLGWLTEVSLMGAALTPLVKRDTKKWHYGFGIAAGIFSQVCVAWLCADWLFTWSVFVFLMGSLYVQPQGWLAKAVEHKGVTVAECVCFIALIGSLLTRNGIAEWIQR